VVFAIGPFTTLPGASAASAAPRQSDVFDDIFSNLAGGSAVVASAEVVASDEMEQVKKMKGLLETFVSGEFTNSTLLGAKNLIIPKLKLTTYD
jgi:hypothetical protein